MDLCDFCSKKAKATVVQTGSRGIDVCWNHFDKSKWKVKVDCNHAATNGGMTHKGKFYCWDCWAIAGVYLGDAKEKPKPMCPKALVQTS